MDAKWHFFVMSHGKGACDGIGGTIKRLARKADLQNPCEEQIMTPRQLYEWAVVKIASFTFEYCAVEDHGKEMMMLKEGFRKAQTLMVTQKIQCHSCLKKLSSDKSIFKSRCVQHHIYSVLAR
jgi:hypothetical protein